MFSKKSNVKVARGRDGAPAQSAAGLYLRTDIGCGVLQCERCQATAHTGYAPCIDVTLPIMVPDTNILLHNINVLEDIRVRNIIFLGTVLNETQNRNRTVYSRVQALLNDPTKACYVFSNDKHEGTFTPQKVGESPNDYNDRMVRAAALWLARHLASHKSARGVHLVTHDAALRALCAAERQGAEVGATNFLFGPLREFLSTVTGVDDALLEMAAYTIVEGMKENPSTSAVYAEHEPPLRMAQGVTERRLLKGKLRVSDTSCFFGEIRGKWEGRGFDRVLIAGRIAMNRALHDDIVCVALLPPQQWRAPTKAAAPLPAGATEKEALDAKYSPCGMVVGILEVAKRQFCGSICTSDVEKLDGAVGEHTVMFQPKKTRIPRIRLRTRQLDGLKDKRLLVVVDEWPSWSSAPLGHYIEVIGVAGDEDAEARVILMENDVPHYDFSQAVYDCLPKGQWAVEASEEATRLDLRDLCICSVDPLGCRDIDDALHYRTLENGNVEVGVHIADVTHFLKENSPMDVEAAKRSTSVYLVDRRINMLPQLLTENLCSIVGNEDRYAFSITWEFDQNNNVVRDWFGKTIIRSRAALYYGDAQAMIDDDGDNSELAVSLKGLMRLSKVFKTKREADGALFLASQEFKFKKVDNDHVNPTDMVAYKTFDANSMIEEWMLYANAAAASKIYSVFPRWALLRRHQSPAEGSFESLNEAIFEKVGMRLDPTTSLSLNNSLNRCESPTDAFFNRLIRMLTTRCLKQAQYFSSGDVPFEEFLHFGLAMPIYTHFTSPIRRYADVIVHRQLAAAIGLFQVSEEHTSPEYMERLAGNINYRHEQAQKAGRDSQNFFTGHYLRQFEKTGIPDEDGYIVRLTDTHFFVMVPRYGQEGKIDRESLPNAGAAFRLLDKVRIGISITEKGDVFGKQLQFVIKDTNATPESPVAEPTEKKLRTEAQH